MKLLYLIIVSSFLSGCITFDEMKSKIVSNNTNETKQEEIKEVKNNFNKTVIKNTNENKTIKFVHWKCYEHFGDDAKLILTVGFFPQITDELLNQTIPNKSERMLLKSEGGEIGMVELKTTSKQLLSFYMLRGVKHNFMWGGKKFQNYMIEIDTSGRGNFYNFEGAKQNEKRPSTETFNCKSGYPETVMLDKEELKDFMK